MIIESAVSELTAVVGTTHAWAAAGRPRATHYRRLRPPAPKPKREPALQPRALTVVSACLAERLLADTIAKQGVDRSQLTIHADRGSSMASKPVALLLADLGVTKSHSRPHCPNDNPFSESQFKTMKYRPDFPERFGSQQHAHDFCRIFFPWYCNDHRHSGIGYHTPADVHYGRAEMVRARRAGVLTVAYAAHPERFVRKPPEPPQLPGSAWINRPVEEVVPTQ